MVTSDSLTDPFFQVGKMNECQWLNGRPYTISDKWQSNLFLKADSSFLTRPEGLEQKRRPNGTLKEGEEGRKEISKGKQRERREGDEERKTEGKKEGRKEEEQSTPAYFLNIGLCRDNQEEEEVSAASWSELPFLVPASTNLVVRKHGTAFRVPLAFSPAGHMTMETSSDSAGSSTLRKEMSWREREGREEREEDRKTGKEGRKEGRK
ncbi:mak5, partial [Ophiophagus hannah]